MKVKVKKIACTAPTRLLVLTLLIALAQFLAGDMEKFVLARNLMTRLLTYTWQRIGGRHELSAGQRVGDV